MKRTVLPLLLTAALLGQDANAQSSSTPVIGYYKADVPLGASSWVCGFVRKKDFQGAATSMTAGTPNSVINQSGATFGTFTDSYVEILSGTQAGLILDVVSNTASSITVEGNTAALGLTGTETYCVRKHASLGSILPDGGGLAPNEDIVILIDSAGTESNAVYDGAGTWFDLVSAANLTNTPIYPGQGFVILANAARVMTIGGNDVSYVKSGPTRISLYAFIPNLVGLVNPLVGIETTTAETWNLKSITPNSDLVIKPTQDGAFDTQYNYIFDGTNITDISTGGDLDTDPIKNGTSLIFVPDGDKQFVIPQTHP